MRLALLVVLLAGCGGAQHPSSTAPACDEVAAHLLVLAQRDNQAETTPATAAGIHGEFARQCRDERWSAARRDCLIGAEDQEATLTCPAH